MVRFLPVPLRLLRALRAIPLILAATILPVHADMLQDAAQSLRQGQYPQALTQVDRFLADKPRDAQGRFLRGVILTELGKRQEAITVFTRLTEDYPELPEPYNNLAVIYAQQKQYDKARQALEAAIRTHPSYATAHENLGDIYARMASQAYDKALQLDSSNAVAQTKLSMIRDLMSLSRRDGRPVTVAAASTAPIPSAPPASTPARPASAPLPVPATLPQAEPSRPVASAAAKPVPPPVQAPPATPASRAEPIRPAAADASAEVSRIVEAWAGAWSKKDVKAYLAHYARDFRTPGGVSRKTWEAERSQRLLKPGAIHVTLGNLRVEQESPDRAIVYFRQGYRSANLKSDSSKVLVMIRHDGRWLIQQERIGG
ncbi:MAG: tetratricopeptide repeat protein [Proteobacteria bacterium]|nr:tetratricopeptide repeat protein [Pseudomonadota bacterium]HQR03674.1 tetratricopeptide repeat protein [Rhodocyclaceae bacterium]